MPHYADEFNIVSKIPVAILAATGSVGQRFVQLLDGHPWFQVAAITGSGQREGEKYRNTTKWILPDPMPEWVEDMIIQPSDPAVLSVPLVFSALPSSHAERIEPLFARAGVLVCSNAGAFRTAPDVPILLPEINAGHLDLLHPQQARMGWTGAIITNPNCTSTGMTIVLKALSEAFGVNKVFATSLQALSGAGYPGVASLDILDNVIPYIGDEEEKLEWEPRKMLGSVQDGTLHLAPIQISAHTNRVAVSDGHTVCMSIGLENPPPINMLLDAVRDRLKSYQAQPAARELPSTPRPVIVVRDEPDRPQPRLDRMTGGGMTTVVGRLRHDSILDLRLVVLSHNTIRGAAGGSIYNAELLYSQGWLG